MEALGNFFAIGILMLISMVFFRNKYFLTKASKCYVVLLVVTLASTVLNSVAVECSANNLLSIPAMKAVGTLDLILLSLTVLFLSIYLILKITEHSIEGENLTATKICLSSVFAVSVILLIIDLPYGFIFTVNENGACKGGKFLLIPYILMVLKLAVVAFYAVKYRKKLSNNVKMALIQSIPVLIFCIIVKLFYPDTSLITLTIALIEMVFFLNFQNQRIGVNTLTKLSDSRRFLNEVARRIKKQAPFKAYIIKIKNIGIIKQNFSNKVGDEVLYQFGFFLGKQFSHSAAFHLYDTVFGLVLPYNEETEREETDAVISLMNKRGKYKDTEISLECISAEHIWKDEATADNFYEKLEYALTVAEKNRLQIVTYSLDHEMARVREKYLINRMQNVSSEEGFEVWFQPIFSNAQNGFTSMEVLLRLKEKNGSYVSPAEFIPIAEETGQIDLITWFVIEETCKVLANNPELGHLRASINLPMLHLIDPDFEDRLNAIINKYGIPHKRISFEFTERVILDDLTLVERNMKQLAKRGYSFYLDDFGVGYSNFNCVLRLPLKTVKLDMTLTATAEKLVENHALVSILTDLFHDMGLNVVAEGAETAEQVELLRAYGVDGVQGYYYAKPMPLEKLKVFIADQKTKKEAQK